MHIHKNTLPETHYIRGSMLLLAAMLVLVACRPAVSTLQGRSIEQARELILAYLHDQKPDLADSFSIDIEERPLKNAWELLQVQIFTVTGESFDRETFLLHDGEVIQLGSAIGGSGVNSLEVSDLDQDGSAELVFTYSFGSGIHQSWIGIYAPAYDPHGTFSANFIYLGDIVLVKDKAAEVQVQIAASDTVAQKTGQQEILGQLTLTQNMRQPVFTLETRSGLPQEIEQNLLPID